MNDIEAFLLFLAYMLPFGGMVNLVIGITENNNSKIIFGIVCIFATLLIMGYLLYCVKKEHCLLTKRAEKTKLIIGMFRHITVSCILMIVEFWVMWNFGILVRYIILIICISLIIMTIIVTILEKF